MGTNRSQGEAIGASRRQQEQEEPLGSEWEPIGANRRQQEQEEALGANKRQ